MGIVFKHILKNTLGNIKRTLLIVFCIMICALIAMITFDFTDAFITINESYASSFFGTADFIYTGYEEMKFLEDEDFPAYNAAKFAQTSVSLYRRLDGEYSVIRQDVISVYSSNIEEAIQIGLFEEGYSLSSNEVSISKTLATKYSFSVGDEILLSDKDGNRIPFLIAHIESFDKGFLEGDTVFISDEGYESLYGTFDAKLKTIDVLDDNLRLAAKELLDAKYSSYDVLYLYDTALLEEGVNQTKLLFGLILAICLLMVSFVTFSVSERIITERMSVVGTLRSLGMNMKGTALVLLLENAFYGFLGGFIGIIIYLLIRNPVLELLWNLGGDSNVTVDYGVMNCGIAAIVLICAILLECICSIKEILKSIKTSIRDIIFSNKDTAYVIKKGSIIAGTVLFVIGVVSMVFKNQPIMQIISIVFIEIGFAFLIPILVSFIGRFVVKRFQNTNKPVITMAVKESFTKKNTVGTAVLIGTVAVLCMILINIAVSLGGSYSYGSEYLSDIVVDTSEEEYMYSYFKDLPDVTDVETIYSYFFNMSIDGTKISEIVLRGPGEENWRNYNPYDMDPSTISADEMIVPVVWANQYGFTDGQMVEVIFRDGSFLPVTRTLKIVVDSRQGYYGHICINPELFDQLAPLVPDRILVNSTDPDTTIATIRKYSGTTIYEDDTYTQAEMKEQARQQCAQIIAILAGIIVLGVVVTIIGSTGNLLLGFESRRREFAVLLSTAMNNKQLSGMLLLESLFSTGFALLAAFPVALLMTVPLKSFLLELADGISFKVYPLWMLLLLLVLWIIFTSMAFVPIKSIRKMKLSEQLKYE